MFTGLTLLGFIVFALCVWRAMATAPMIDASHPDAVTGLDRLQADGVIAYAYRGYADPAAAEYAARHHGGAA